MTGELTSAKHVLGHGEGQEWCGPRHDGWVWDVAPIEVDLRCGKEKATCSVRHEEYHGCNDNPPVAAVHEPGPVDENTVPKEALKGVGDGLEYDQTSYKQKVKKKVTYMDDVGRILDIEHKLLRGTSSAFPVHERDEHMSELRGDPYSTEQRHQPRDDKQQPPCVIEVLEWRMHERLHWEYVGDAGDAEEDTCHEQGNDVGFGDLKHVVLLEDGRWKMKVLKAADLNDMSENDASVAQSYPYGLEVRREYRGVTANEPRITTGL
jgi:hypothetical protein